MMDKRIQVLKEAAKNKGKNALSKVKSALSMMQAKNIPINFNSLAKLAGVSKTWLYSQPELKKEIEAIRGQRTKIHRVIDLQSTVQKKNNDILSLKEKNKKQEEIIKKLRRQLEVVYGELYKMKNASSYREDGV